MSRVGKNPVGIPEKVEVKVADNCVFVKGPLGKIERIFPHLVEVKLQDKRVVISPTEKSKKAYSMWGTSRAIIANMILGVSQGVKKELEFNGVGYKANVQGRKLVLHLGYSHPIDYNLPEGINAKVIKNTIEISGVNKEVVGLVADKIRSFRRPDPYKGKGVKYVGEHIIRKAGKAGGKK